MQTNVRLRYDNQEKNRLIHLMMKYRQHFKRLDFHSPVVTKPRTNILRKEWFFTCDVKGTLLDNDEVFIKLVSDDIYNMNLVFIHIGFLEAYYPYILNKLILIGGGHFFHHLKAFNDLQVTHYHNVRAFQRVWKNQFDGYEPIDEETENDV